MADADIGLYSLNAGEVSALALARVDLAKMKMACQKQQNWLPHVLGPAMMRPGTAYTGCNTKSDAAGKLLEFYFDATNKALLVLTANFMRVVVGGAAITPPAVPAAVTNGTFAGNIAGWTDSDEAGATSVYA